MQNATLVLLSKGNPVSEVLLGYKKIGFGQGKYTGFGGKIEPGEQVVGAALRELFEETSLTIPNPDSLDLAALIKFRFPHKPTWSQNVYVLTAQHWQGTPIESDEMIPHWFPVEMIPYQQMWDDACYWLPRILAGEKFQANIKFKANNQSVEEVEFGSLDLNFNP